MGIQALRSNMNNATDILQAEALALLKELVATPSFSKEEDQSAIILNDFLKLRNIETKRIGNNIIAYNKHFDPSKKSILLNSHHDTVRPNKGYTIDPFTPLEKDGKLYGLGSNDAGGALVSLVAAFHYYHDRPNLKYNIILAATAEEEISGVGGIEKIKEHLPQIDFAIVGEPTLLKMAIAEKGLMVLDCIATGKAGHAARDEGENALYKAMQDIEWIRNHRFEKVSELLGPVKMTVTVIETDNKTHNIVPSHCQFVVDVRSNELYNFEEIIDTIKKNIGSQVTPRSTRLRSTIIDPAHPVVKAGLNLGSNYYGSPTTSDKALMPFPALKIGPGDSARSHTADEFIHTDEIRQGIGFYIELLKQLL